MSPREGAQTTVPASFAAETSNRLSVLSGGTTFGAGSSSSMNNRRSTPSPLQLSPVRVTISPAISPQEPPRSPPAYSSISTHTASPHRSTQRDSDSESIRSDITIDDLGSHSTPRISIRTDVFGSGDPPLSPVPRAVLSPVPSSGRQSWAPSSPDSDLFFRPEPFSRSPSQLSRFVPQPLNLGPSSSSVYSHLSAYPHSSPNQSHFDATSLAASPGHGSHFNIPPPLTPPPVSIPDVPRSPRSVIRRFSTQSTVNPFTTSSDSLARTQGGSHSNDESLAVIAHASVHTAAFGESQSSLVPVAVAPAVYRDASTALDLRPRASFLTMQPKSTSPTTHAPPRHSESSALGRSARETEVMLQDTYALSERSLPLSAAVASTIAPSERSESREHLTDMPRVRAKERPMSWGSSTGTSRSVGQRLAATVWGFASGLRSRRLSQAPAPPPPARAMNVHPDRDLDLQHLAKRAIVLGDMLAAGRLPNESIRSVPLAGHDGPSTSHARSVHSLSGAGMRSRFGRINSGVREEDRRSSKASKPRRRVTIAIASTFTGAASHVTPFSDAGRSSNGAEFASLDASDPNGTRTGRRWTKRRMFIIVVIVGLIILVVLLSVILTLHRNGASSVSVCNAPDTAGVLCNLDSSCVCTGTDKCVPLAAALVSTLPIMNRNFNLNVSASQMALTMWGLTLPRASLSCPAQASLIDVGPSLDGIAFPTRTSWAQSALLWVSYSSLSIEAVQDLKDFVSAKNFTTLGSDAPVTGDSGSSYRVKSLGYQFDFAAMTAIADVVSFEDAAQPDENQLAALNTDDVSILNNIHTAARATSLERANALETYWQADLNLPKNRLADFVTAMQNSPVILPFDATLSQAGSAINELFTNETRLHIPPPAACYPNVDNGRQTVAQFEQKVFNISDPGAQTDWKTSCFERHPTYGRLNPFRWRAPFLQTGSAGSQALMLNQAAKSRLVYHLQPLLDSYPHDLPPADLGTSFVDYREYGTLVSFNHTLLAFLEAMPSIRIAAKAALYISNLSKSPGSAPPSDSEILEVASSLPVIGVVLFGSIASTDVSGFISDFSSPSGSLFFGSKRATRFRAWVFDVVKSHILWANGATASQYVSDTQEDDATLQSIWTQAGELLDSGTPTEGRSPLDTVLELFERALYFES